MGARRVIWHVGFERVLRRRGPPSFEVRSEVPLSEEPPRLDYLLLRKLPPDGELVDQGAQTLRALWPRLPRVSVVEYKSPGRPYRSGQLDRLWAYVHTYFAHQRALPRQRADGTLLTPAEGGPEVRARDELVGSSEVATNMADMEGYKELMDKLLDTLPAEQVLSHYGPEQRLAGLPPEQRLAGLDCDHQALALPVEVLQLLPEEYLRSLSPEAEAEIRRRLRQR